MLVSAGGLSLIVLACKVAGFGEKILVAHCLGTSQAADCYYAAFSLVWTVTFVVLELVQPSLLPVYSAMDAAGAHRQARRLATVVGAFLAAGLFCVAAAWAVAPGVFAALVVPGFDDVGRGQTQALLRNMAVGTAVLALCALTRTLLNAHRRFWWAALGDLAFRVIYLAVFAAGWLGWQCNLAGWAIAAGAIAVVTVHATGLRRVHRTAAADAASQDLSAALRQVLLLASPLVIGIACSHASQLLDSVLASMLPAGRLSALAYAKKLTDTIVLLGPAGLATVTFSHFAAWAASGEHAQIHRQLARCVRIVLLVGVPLALLIALARYPIVRMLFERGRFDPTSTQLTASALGCYAIGIVAFSLDGLLVGTFYALRDMRTPVALGVAAVLCDIVLAWLLMQRFGHVGIALSVSITKTIKIIILGLLLRRRLPAGKPGAMARWFVRLAGAALAFALAVGLVAWRLNWCMPRSGRLTDLASVAVLTLVGGATYVAAGRLLHISEFGLIAGRLSRVVLRRSV